MQTLKSQRGMTAIGWLFVLGLIGFFALLAMRMIPKYLEFYSVESTLDSFLNEPGMSTKTPQDVRTLVAKRFNINAVTSVSAKEVAIQNTGSAFLISVDYEVREPVFGNVDVIMSFVKEVEVPRN